MPDPSATLPVESLNQCGDADGEEYFDAPDHFSAIFHAVNTLGRSAASDPRDFIFLNRQKALDLTRKQPGCRYKPFTDYKDALAFVESPRISTLFTNAALKPQAGGDAISPVSQQEPARSPKKPDGPKCAFPIPSQIMLNKLAETIQSNDVAGAIKSFDQNPCFLINEVDAPTIFKISMRYNGAHLCALNDCPEILSALLSRVRDIKYTGRMYANHSDGQTRIRCNRLVDLYINSHDRVINDTPLHIACKRGHVKIIECLVSFPETRVLAKNKFRRTPAEVIPESGANSYTHRQILDALNGIYFVPVFEREENGPGSVGKPCDSSILHLPSDSPVRALAGPMTMQKADELVHEYKQRRRKLLFNVDRADIASNIEKGAENVLREITREWNVKFAEQWPFCDGLLRLSSEEGLQLLDLYLRQRYLTENCAERIGPLRIQDSNVLSDRFRAILDSLAHGEGLRSFDNQSELEESINDISRTDDLARSVFDTSIRDPCGEDNSDDSICHMLERLALDSSLDDSGTTSAHHVRAVFLKGSKISQLDKDAYHAVVGSQLSVEKLPFVKRWLVAVRDSLSQ